MGLTVERKSRLNSAATPLYPLAPKCSLKHPCEGSYLRLNLEYPRSTDTPVNILGLSSKPDSLLSDRSDP